MSPLTAEAQRRAAQVYVRRSLQGMDLMEFIPTVTPDYDPPHHLQPMVDMVQKALRESGVRGVTSVPPQHGKSDTLFHLLCSMLNDDPTKRHLYGTYSITFAGEQSLKAQRIAERCYLPLERVSMNEWVTPQGGGILWVGRGGRMTGKPVDGLAVVDDPLKNWQEARSPTIRQRAIDFVREVVQRLHPGASIILNATRWHPNDPSGHYISKGWEHVNLPAVDDQGRALWPEHRPLPFLMQQKADVGPHDWAAVFMGNPQPRDTAIFQTVPLYDQLPPPEQPYEAAWGFDGAYTAKARADWTVAVQGRRYDLPNGDWRIYLTDLVRMQRDADDVPGTLKAAGVGRVTWRRSGTEKGMAALLRREGISVREVTATGDKLAAAQPLANDWRKGRILAPAHAPWLSTLEAEVLAFTGTAADEHDDIVDALGSLHHELVLYRGPDIEAARRASGL